MTQEQIIKWLECCAEGKCEVCPYETLCFDEEISVCTPMARDVLSMLKPRLLTDADFIDNPNVDSEGNLPAWIEYRRDEDWAEYWDDTKDEWAIVRKTNFKATGYRCWNAKPSKEQMEATEWEKEEDDAASSEKP